MLIKSIKFFWKRPKLMAVFFIGFLGTFLAYSGYWCWQFNKLNSHYVEHNYDHTTQSVSYSITLARPDYWVPLEDMKEKVYGAIVVSEDWGFYQHRGIDFFQIKDAIFSAFKRRKVRGASTITQQLIKNLYLTHERSLMRKLKEAIFAIGMEIVLRKEKILETYLNIIEYGEGLYGIHNASLHYFQKLPQNLRPREGAFFAMLLPGPKSYSLSFKNRKLSRFASGAINDILKKMRVAGHLSDDELKVEVQSMFSWEDRSFVMDDSSYYEFN